MSPLDLTFVYPGDINTRTGGYRYDKRIIEGIQSADRDGHCWNVTTMSLAGDYPFPTQTQRQQASQALATIADGALTVVDGLAYSTMPEVIEAHAQRLTFIALVHHPLALETGLTETQSAELKLQETEALRFARHVISTSHSTAESLNQYHVSADRVSAILPGTDKADVATGSKNGASKLLCVATLTPRKGHAVLLDALATLTHLPWLLVCAGSKERDAQTYTALVEQCSELKLDDRVSFAGELDDQELANHYSTSDLFVLASYHEGYGMVLTEAIASGLPIICSNAGAMASTVPEGCGLLVPPGDASALSAALEQYLSNDNLRSKLKEASLQARGELRSWRDACDEFSHLLFTVHSG